MSGGEARPRVPAALPPGKSAEAGQAVDHSRRPSCSSRQTFPASCSGCRVGAVLLPSGSAETLNDAPINEAITWSYRKLVNQTHVVCIDLLIAELASYLVDLPFFSC